MAGYTKIPADFCENHSLRALRLFYKIKVRTLNQLRTLARKAVRSMKKQRLWGGLTLLCAAGLILALAAARTPAETALSLPAAGALTFDPWDRA